MILLNSPIMVIMISMLTFWANSPKELNSLNSNPWTSGRRPQVVWLLRLFILHALTQMLRSLLSFSQSTLMSTLPINKWWSLSIMRQLVKAWSPWSSCYQKVPTSKILTTQRPRASIWQSRLEEPKTPNSYCKLSMVSLSWGIDQVWLQWHMLAKTVILNVSRSSFSKDRRWTKELAKKGWCLLVGQQL